MTAPHELPISGVAADFATTLAAHLPVLDTPRLRLRCPRLTDFPLWAQILTGPAGPYLGGPFTRDAAFAEFATSVGTWLLRGHGPWTVETRDGSALGFVLIGFEPGDLEPELGFLFAPHAEGHGYAQEAAHAAAAHAATQGFTRLVSYIAPENHRSQRLAARLGAQVEAGTFDGSTVWVHNLKGDAA